MTSAITLKELSVLKESGLKILAEHLGPIGMINFIRLFSNGEGDYTEEQKDYDFTEEEFLKYAAEHGETI